MRRFVLVPAIMATLIVLGATSALAGSPHFVSVTPVRQGSSLSVGFKEAGLGNEPQVHVVVGAVAECINGGGKHPQAVNKESVTSAGDFPVQNGRAEGALLLTASFTPQCSPPMTIRFSRITINDTTSGISKTLSGTY